MPDEITTRTTTFDEATLRRRRAEQRQAADARRRRYPSAWMDPNYYADPANAWTARFLTSRAAQAPNAMAYWNRQQIAAQATMLAPQSEAMLNRYMDTGIVDPEIASGLADVAASIGIDDDTVNAIATLDATAKTMAGEDAQPSEQNSEADKGGLARFFGSITRPLFAMMSLPAEWVLAEVRNEVDKIQEHGWGTLLDPTPPEDDVDAWKQTLGGQWLRGVIDPNYSSDLGDGWFPAGEVRQRQAMAARSAAPLVHGHAWTPGRGVASLFLEDPESHRYRNLSGLIDLTANVVLDPLVILGGAGAAVRGAAKGQRVAKGVRTSEVAKAQRAEAALREPETWLVPHETVGAARDYVAKATRAHVKGQQASGQLGAAQRLADATATYDRTVDTLSMARSDAAFPGTRELSGASIANRIKRATEALEEDDIGSLAANIDRQAPDLPGTFTDALPSQRSTIVGTHDGLDALITQGKSRLASVSVDDALDSDALLGSIRSLKAPKRAKDRARDTVRSAIDDSGGETTWIHVLDRAVIDGTGGTVGAAMRAQGIDVVTDMFRMKGGAGGVWWLSPETEVVRWSDGAWQHVARTSEALDARVTELTKAQRRLARERGVAKRQLDEARALADQLADEYSAVMDGLLNSDDAVDVVRAAVEYGMGVRRVLGGRPAIDENAVKQFFFGTPSSYDAAAGAGVTGTQRALRAADRALLGTVTLGASEALRAAKRLTLDPLMATARRKVLDDLVALDDTVENLGRLHRLTRGKINPGVLRAALGATDEAGVLSALAPEMGVRVERPITPGILDAARTRIFQTGTGRDTDHLLSRGIRWMIDEAERLGTIAPRGLVGMNFADPVGSANTFRNYLDNIPNLDSRTTDQIMGRYLSAASEQGRARAVMDGFDEVHAAISARHAAQKGWSEETVDTLNRALKQAVQVYDGGRAEVNTWWSKRYVADGLDSIITARGERVPLPGPQLEAELARGGVVLPSAATLRDSMGRWGAFLQDGKIGPVVLGERTGDIVGRKARDVVGNLNDVWRSSVLYRPAYVIRNIGEMQSRMFLAGHTSVFRHPLAVFAFAVAANTRSDKVRRLMELFTKANRAADGFTFSSVDVEDLKGMSAALDEFAESTLARTSRLDMRTHRAMEAFHGLEEVGVGKAGFNAGLAEQLIMMRSSRLSRIVAGNYPAEVTEAIARGTDVQDAVVNWILTSRQGEAMRKTFSDNDPAFAAIFGNPRLDMPGDPVALKQLLYTAEGSVAKRIQYYTQGEEELLEFIRTGVLKSPTGKEVFTMAIDAKDPQVYNQALRSRGTKLARKLKPYVDRIAERNPDTKLYLRVLRTKGERDPFQFFDWVFDFGFNWAGRMENAISVGPEFAFAYHQKLAQLLPSIRRQTVQGTGEAAVTRSDRQQVFDVVKAAEGRMRSLSETMQIARSGMRSKEDGMLTLEDASAMAARHASEHVKTFFYDALRRQQVFHALRVVFPFAQSFVDTLYRWGSLVAERPYMMEKVGRLGTALTEPGSNIIYDNFDYIDPLTNRQTNDPKQGFLWTDPQTGQTRFTFPLIGSAMGALLSPVAGAMVGEPVDLAASMSLEAPLRNLNIALQGDVDYLPGVGPLLTVPSTLMMPDDAFGAFPEWLRSYLFPYGKPRLGTGVVEALFFPTWLRRLTGFLYNEENRAYAVKGSMSYLLSTREYPGFRSDPAVQQEFIADVKAMSQVMALIRSFGAAWLPAAPTQEIFAEDTSGNLVATSYIADRWYNLLETSNWDTEMATKALVDTYGLATLAAIQAPSWETDVRFSHAAWEFFKNNPQRGKSYADVIGYFFPGDYSFEANNWVRATNRRRGLSIAERTEDVREFLYFAERRMIEGRAAKEGWDTGAIDMAIDELDASYADVLPEFEVGGQEAELAKIERALGNFPELAATRGGQGAVLLFESYNRLKAEAESLFGHGATLSSQQATLLREEFLRDVERIARQYGGHNLETGSVDTIAAMFARLVEPRE